MGLENPSCLCYMNSALQCLLHTPHLIKANANNELQSKKTCNCTKAFVNLLKEMSNESSTQSYFPVTNLLNELRKEDSNFKSYGQQDSFEFLIRLIDILNKELNRVVHKPKYKELKSTTKNYEELVIYNKIL